MNKKILLFIVIGLVSTFLFYFTREASGPASNTETSPPIPSTPIPQPPLLDSQNDAINGEQIDNPKPLTVAIEKGDLEQIASLIESETIQFENKDYLGRPPALALIEAGFFEQYQMLIQQGSPIDPLSNDARSPGLVAIEQKNNQWLEFILAQGANANQIVGADLTYAMVAVIENNTEAIDLLAKYGADLNRKNPSGKTPLMLAIIEQNLEAAKKLLAYDVDESAVDNLGKSWMDYCEESQNDTLISLCQER
jgi:ankyrin repeat protein